MKLTESRFFALQAGGQVFQSHYLYFALEIMGHKGLESNGGLGTTGRQEQRVPAPTFSRTPVVHTIREGKTFGTMKIALSTGDRVACTLVDHLRQVTGNL